MSSDNRWTYAHSVLITFIQILIRTIEMYMKVKQNVNR